MKVTRIHNVVPITDKKRKRPSKSDFQKILNNPSGGDTA